MSTKKVSFSVKPAPKGKLAATPDAWVEQRTVENDDTPEPIKRLTIDIPDSLHRRVKAQCAQEGVKMVEVIRDLLEQRFPA